MKQFLELLKFARYTMFHPFDGFYEIKYRDRGNALIATIFIVITAILAVVSAQFNGFLINFTNPARMNSFSIILFNITPLLIFVVANYSTTTLFDGKGLFREIYTVVGYSLLPFIIIKLFLVFLSNVLTYDELALYTLFMQIGRVWFYFLVFCGLVVVHEYGFFKTIITLLATALAIAIITFLGLLFFALFQQLLAFISIFIEELSLRLEVWL